MAFTVLGDYPLDASQASCCFCITPKQKGQTKIVSSSAVIPRWGRLTVCEQCGGDIARKLGFELPEKKAEPKNNKAPEVLRSLSQAKEAVVALQTAITQAEELFSE